MKPFRSLLFFICCLFLLAACGGEEPAGNAGKEPAGTSNAKLGDNLEPITLTVYTNENQGLMNDQIEAIQERFPHITFQPLYWNAGPNLEELVSSGQIPDMVQYTLGSFWPINESGMLTDLTDLIKEFDFDASTLRPNVLDAVKSYSASGEILFMPYSLTTGVLYYNMDIFDRFGVEYPSDRLTWDDVYDMAVVLTREEDGVQYKGFQYQNQHMVWKNQLALPVTDPETNKTLVNSDGWKQWVKIMGDFYRIPGNEYGGSFHADLNIAMYTGPNQLHVLIEAHKTNGMNWDVANLPKFKGAEDEGSQMISPFLGISPATKHRKEAFRVIQFMLSEEMQVRRARSGVIPIIQSETAIEQFGLDLEGVEGKNLKAFFEDEVGTSFPITPYDDITKTALFSKILPAYFNGDDDLNTIFRLQEDEINAAILEAMQ